MEHICIIYSINYEPYALCDAQTEYMPYIGATVS